MEDVSVTFDQIMAEKAGKEITETHKKDGAKLREFIRRRVAGPEDAEDILQDVFADLVEMYRLVKPVEQVSAWLFRVAKNKIIDRYRKKKESRLEDAIIRGGEEDEKLLLSEVIPSDESDPHAKLVREAVMDELSLALAELPPDQREVFTLHELEGYSFAEISKLTGTGMNTLLSRKRYAVLFLRERLRSFYEDMLNT